MADKMWYNTGVANPTKATAAVLLTPRGHDTMKRRFMMQLHSTTTTKRCSHCGEIKPATMQFFARHSKRPDGFQDWCKACKSADYLAKKSRYAEKHKAYAIAHQEQTRKYKQAYHLANKERANARGRKRYEEKKGEILDYQRAYYVENREHIIERVAKYSASNPGSVRAQKRRHYESNKAAYYDGARRRRARKAGAEGTYTAKDVSEQYNRQKGRCYYCSNALNKIFHIDHVVPLSRGGSNSPDNLVCACPSCNLSKGSKLPHEWAQGGRLL